MATSATTSTTISTLSSVDLKNTSQEVEMDSWITTTSPRIVFLAVFLCLGFTGNLFLIITVCHSRQFRSVYFFISIVNLAVVNISECLLNMSVLLATSILKTWNFGTIPCRLSAFFLHVVSVETTLGLTLLTSDRLIAVRFKEKYEHVVSNPRLAIFIFFTWLQSVAFSFPIAIGAIPAADNDYIYYCSISQGSSIIYGVFATFFCFIIPLIVIIIFFVKIIRTGYKDRLLIRNLISQHHYKDDTLQEPKIKQDIRHTNLAGTLCITWLLLEGPHVATFYFKQFQQSSELENVSTEDLRYAWYIDMVLLWLRFSYPLALPIACFTWNKDLWKAFKDIVLCRKNNAVVDESLRKHTDSATLGIGRQLRDEKQKESLCHHREDRVFHVPVLFATARGVHIKTYDQDTTDNESDAGQFDKQDRIGIRGKKCDVIGSRENLNALGDDTSDYDSGNEMDPFSVSHPISGKNLGPITSPNHRRSSSQPEVRANQIAKNRDKETFDAPSNGDSGLDLSLGQDSSLLTRYKQNSRGTVDKSEAIIINNQHPIVESIDHVCEIDKTTQVIDNNDNESAKTTESNNSKVSKEKRKVVYHGSQLLDSPTVKLKKKKHRNKVTEECRSTSSMPSSPLPPIRAPPRLVPIRTSDSVAGVSDNVLAQAENKNSEVISGVISDTYDKVNSEPQSLQKNGEEHVQICTKDGRMLRNPSEQLCNAATIKNSNNLSLDCSRNDDEEDETDIIVSPSACAVLEKIVCSGNNDHPSQADGPGYRVLTSDRETNGVPTPSEAKMKNAEARRKRRERMLASPNSLLLDNKGYTRLMPDTP